MNTSFVVNLDSLKKRVQEFLLAQYPNDYFHLLRVSKLVEKISQQEGGNLEVLQVSALTHDLCRPWELETGKSHFGDEALNIIRAFLEKSSFSRDFIFQCLEIIKRHDEYDWSEKKNDKSIELQIIQDADNLDALGAIGISRVFSFGGAYDVPIYIPDENLTFTHDFVEKPGERRTSIAHFYDKLLKLKDNMNTITGKKLAEDRHQYMVEYLDRFFREYEI